MVNGKWIRVTSDVALGGGETGKTHRGRRALRHGEDAGPDAGPDDQRHGAGHAPSPRAAGRRHRARPRPRRVPPFSHRARVRDPRDVAPPLARGSRDAPFAAAAGEASRYVSHACRRAAERDAASIGAQRRARDGPLHWWRGASVARAVAAQTLPGGDSPRRLVLRGEGISELRGCREPVRESSRLVVRAAGADGHGSFGDSGPRQGAPSPGSLPLCVPTGTEMMWPGPDVLCSSVCGAEEVGRRRRTPSISFVAFHCVLYLRSSQEPAVFDSSPTSVGVDLTGPTPWPL